MSAVNGLSAATVETTVVTKVLSILWPLLAGLVATRCGARPRENPGRFDLGSDELPQMTSSPPLSCHIGEDGAKMLRVGYTVDRAAHLLEPPGLHDASYAGGIVAVALVDLHLEHCFRWRASVQIIDRPSR